MLVSFRASPLCTTRENRIIADRISLTSFISRKNRATHKESVRITRIMGNIMNSRAFDSRNRRRVVLSCFFHVRMYACMCTTYETRVRVRARADLGELRLADSSYSSMIRR